MSGLTEQVESIINNEVDNFIEKHRISLANIAKKTTKEIHTDIVVDWFGKYSPRSVLAATDGNFVTKSEVYRQGDHRMMDITTEFYTNVEKYPRKPKAEAWRQRHSNNNFKTGYHQQNFDVFHGIDKAVRPNKDDPLEKPLKLRNWIIYDDDHNEIRNGSDDHSYIGVSSNYWILSVLQMARGIIGLPPYVKINKENKKEVVKPKEGQMKTPLERVIQNSNKWNDLGSRFEQKL